MNRCFKVSVLFAVILILAFSVCAVDEIGNITYAPSAGGDPNVCIVSDVKMPVLTAGESAVLSIPVRTASIYTAFDVIGNVSSPDGKLPFELENLSPFSKPITIFFDIDSEIKYDVYVPADTLSGVYPINIAITYVDMFGSSYSKNLLFYIKIDNPSFDGSNFDYLVVSDYSVPETVERDSTFTAEIELKNMSGVKINKASVEVVLPNGINVTNDTAIKGGAFDKGDIAKFKFNLCTAENMDGGNLPISFKVSVYESDNKTVGQEFTFNTIVKVPDDNYYYNPILEITDVIAPEEVTPGDTFDVSVTYKNSGDCDLRYVRTSLTAEMTPNTFVNKTSTSHLIQSLKKGESVTKTYTFKASDEIVGDFYTLEFAAKALYDVSSSQEAEISATQYSGFYAANDNMGVSPYYISEISLPENVACGEEFTLSFNTHLNVSAKNLKVEVTLPEGIVNTTSSVFWYSVAEKGSDFTHSVELMCTDNATAGYGLIKISVSADEKSELSQYAGTYINGSDAGKPGFTISGISIPESADASAPSEFDLTFTVTCINANAEDVNVSINLPSGIINRSISKFYIGDMKKDESVTRTVKLYPTNDVADGFANIEISVSSSETENVGLYTGLYVKNETGNSEDDVPVVIIDEYGYGDDYVLGGSTFPLHLKFRNTSTTGGIKDLKITLASDEDGVFTPAASSNTYFIQSLAPTESNEWNLDIQTKSDINPQSYGLIINISYKNENGIEKSSLETLTIPVRQEMRFNISDLPVINDISMNEDAILSLNCANLGKSTVYNVLIKIQGNFMSSEYEIFAGNVNAGSGYSKNVYLTPTMEGMQEGTVTFQYEDSDGVVTTVEKIISFNAYNNDMNSMGAVMMPDYSDMPVDDMPEDKGGIPLWVWLTSGGVLVVIAIIITVVVLKAKKAKKEDDDEY